MKVILLQDIPKLGKKDELKEVAPGFATNSLFPKKLAILATPKEVQELKIKKEIVERKRKETEDQLKAIAEKIQGLVLNFKEKAEEHGTLYGAIDKAKISESLKQKGFEINEEKIIIFSPLKKIGEYDVEIELLPHLKTKIKIIIEAGE